MTPYKRGRACPICAGHSQLPAGQGKRCYGYLSTDGEYAHCTREEFAGPMPVEQGNTFAHRLQGSCKCGTAHGSEPFGILPPRRQKPTDIQERIRTREMPDKVHLYANGNRKVRWYSRTDPHAKECRWQHLEGTEWVDGKKGDPGLYQADVLTGVDTVLLTESETDAEAVLAAGFPAVSNPHGSAPIVIDHAETMRGRRVVIHEHADEAGQRFAEHARGVLSKIACKVGILKAPSGHKDIREWIEAARPTNDEVRTLIEAALPSPPKGTSAAALLALPIPPLEYAIWPALSLGNLTQLQGEPKSGKSSFALHVALAVAAGRWTSGRWDVPKARRVLFMTWEDGPRRIRARLGEYASGAGLDVPSNLVVYTDEDAPSLELEDATGVRLLRELMLLHKAELVVLDTLSYLHGVDENKAHEMKPVMKALRDLAREHHTAILTIHHTRKSSSGASDQAGISYRGRGSSAIAAAPSSIIDWGNPRNNVTKVGFVSKDEESDSFSVTYKRAEDDSSVSWSLSDAVEDHASLELREKVLAILSDAGDEYLTVSEVAVRMGGAHVNTPRIYLKALVHEGKAEWKLGAKNVRLYRRKNKVPGPPSLLTL